MAGVEDDKATVEFPSLDVGLQTLSQLARSNGASSMYGDLQLGSDL